MTTRTCLAISLGLLCGSHASSQAAPKPADSSRAVVGEAHLAARVSELEAVVRELLGRQARLIDSLARRAQRTDVSTSPLTFSSGNGGGRFRLRLRGYFQSDARFVDDAKPGATTFLLRRVRPVWEATVGPVDLRLMPDFGEGRVTVFDAHADLRLHPVVNVRSGKFKPPLGLERLQSATDLSFIERAMPTSFAPNRDVGVQIYGDVLAGVVQYQVGIFNGVPDLGFGDGDVDNEKDVVGRLFLEPFGRASSAALRELGFGVAASRGVHRGSVTAPFLQTYRTPAQQVGFVFRNDGRAAGTTFADGLHTRVAPQGYWYAGRFGTLWEYTRVAQVVRREALSERLEHAAWNLTSSMTLTGEHLSYRGFAPRRAFDLERNQWGAFEVALRFSGFTIDPNAFPVFADPTMQPSRAESRAVALNWHLNRGIRVMLNYSVTRYRGGSTGGDREPERALQTRIQHSF